MKKILNEFKQFAIRGNVVDLSIGIIIGGAFNGIVQSLVKDVIMPPIGFLLGKIDFSTLFISLGGNYKTLAEAKEAGIPTINYGLFINALIVFIITAFSVFLLVKVINRLRKQEEKKPSDPTTKNCPFCFSPISIKATRCSQCTSQL